MTQLRGLSAGCSLGSGRREPVGVGAGLDDGAVEGEPVDDGRAETGVGVLAYVQRCVRMNVQSK